MTKVKGFTLVELLIATAIFSVVIVVIYSAFGTGMSGFRRLEENIQHDQGARLLLDQLNLDLRNAFGYSTDEAKFTGTADELRMLALVDNEYAFVAYNLQSDLAMRLCRTGKQSLKETSEITSDEVCPNVKKMEFSYGYLDPVSNEMKFKESWAIDKDEEKKVLPLALKLDLTLKGKREENFSRTIYLAATK